MYASIAVIEDYRFIVERLRQVILSLIFDSKIAVDRKENYSDVRVRLRKGEALYRMPVIRRINPVF